MEQYKTWLRQKHKEYYDKQVKDNNFNVVDSVCYNNH